MLLFDDGKRLEKAVGEEAAQIIVSMFERLDADQKKDAATRGDIADVKHDIREAELRLETKIEAAKHELLKWLIGMLVAQTGVLAALYALIR